MSISNSRERIELTDFLVRLGKFLGLFGLVCAVGVGLQKAYFFGNPYRIDDDIQTLITGNSIVQHALDPREIAGSVNLAQGSEGYQYSFFKLRYLLRQNNGVRRVMIGISPENFVDHPHSLSSRDTHLALHANHGIYNLISCIDAVTDQDLGLATFGKGLIRTSLFNPHFYRALASHGQYYPFVGGFRAVSGRRPNLEAVYSSVMGKLYGASDELLYGLSNQSLRYLRRIIELCSDSGVELLVVAVPMQAEHERNIPAAIRSFYGEVIAELRSSNAVALYESDVQEVLDTHFYDPFHLNEEGARVFSRRLNATALLAEGRSK